jgi:glycosyltransferase involved in cell wall biosynthesis
MKILWVKADFLHPTTKGGHIRTLEMLKRLHLRHEIHYVGIEDPLHPEGVARSKEYSSFAYPVRHFVPSKGSLAFVGQLAAGLVSTLPVAVARYRSAAMKRKISELVAAHSFDHIVCDFLFPAPNIPDLSRAVLFEHNVESMIWRRRVEHEPGPVPQAYLRLQAKRMFNYEGAVCRAAAQVITVSEIDADIVHREFGAARVGHVPTGVDLEYFAPPSLQSRGPAFDIVFVGSMDWMPNSEGVSWFLGEILPRIRARRPQTTVCIVGRDPHPKIRALAAQASQVTVTGTVPDVRPYLWGAGLSVVPLRIGSGTRLKIYEAIAAKAPVVSTAVGAEGLPLVHGEHVLIADTEESFAESCVRLMESPGLAQTLRERACELVASRFSWESVAREFERLLAHA